MPCLCNARQDGSCKYLRLSPPLPYTGTVHIICSGHIVSVLLVNTVVVRRAHVLGYCVMVTTIPVELDTVAGLVVVGSGDEEGGWIDGCETKLSLPDGVAVAGTCDVEDLVRIVMGKLVSGVVTALTDVVEYRGLLKEGTTVGACRHFQWHGAMVRQAKPSTQGHIASSAMQAAGSPEMDVV